MRRPHTHSRSPPRRSTRSWRFGPPPRVLARRTSSTRVHSSSDTGGVGAPGRRAACLVLAPVAADPAVVQRVHEDHPDPALGESSLLGAVGDLEHEPGIAVSGDRRAPMGYPAPGRCTLRRVARAAQHRGVGDVERRTASGERHDVIDGQVGSRVGGALVARAPVAVLAAPGAEHAGAEPLPGPRAVEGVVPAAVGLPGVLRAAATRAAGDDTTDRAQLHPQNRRGAWLARSIRLRCYACASMSRRCSCIRGPRERQSRRWRPDGRQEDVRHNARVEARRWASSHEADRLRLS